MHSMGIAFVATVGLGVPKILWETYWALTFLSHDERQVAFETLYKLHEEEIPFGEPPVLTEFVLFDDAVFWLEVSLWVISPDGACLDGCELCVPYPCS